jgi:5S rRNA maturation endonuclease (ribonuclease M5)
MIDRYGKYRDQNDVCWQYKVKESQRSYDADTFGLDRGEISNIRTDDLEFRYIDRDDKDGCHAIRDFIERYEWLGKMPVWVTQRFGAYYNDILVGCVVMATPYTMSKYLGDDKYKKLEKLIARGASSSIAPKNMASWLIMKSIGWMVDNTEYRLFSAYADPEALELGTVYQACNFYYMGQTFGGGYVYIDPENEENGWFGDSYFNQRSVIKRVAIASGVKWEDEYIKLNKTGRKRVIDWDAIGVDLKAEIKAHVRSYRDKFIKYKTARKHKYLYIQGKDRRETRTLRKLFEANTKFYPYPVERGE